MTQWKKYSLFHMEELTWFYSKKYGIVSISALKKASLTSLTTYNMNAIYVK